MFLTYMISSMSDDSISVSRIVRPVVPSNLRAVRSGNTLPDLPGYTISRIALSIQSLFQGIGI